MHGRKFPELILRIVIQGRTVGETCFIHFILPTTAKLKSLLWKASCERDVLGWVLGTALTRANRLWDASVDHVCQAQHNTIHLICIR